MPIQGSVLPPFFLPHFNFLPFFLFYPIFPSLFPPTCKTFSAAKIFSIKFLTFFTISPHLLQFFRNFSKYYSPKFFFFIFLVLKKSFCWEVMYSTINFQSCSGSFQENQFFEIIRCNSKRDVYLRLPLCNPSFNLSRLHWGYVDVLDFLRSRIIESMFILQFVL